MGHVTSIIPTEFTSGPAVYSASSIPPLLPWTEILTQVHVTVPKCVFFAKAFCNCRPYIWTYILDVPRPRKLTFCTFGKQRCWLHLLFVLAFKTLFNAEMLHAFCAFSGDFNMPKNYSVHNCDFLVYIYIFFKEKRCYLFLYANQPR